MIYAGETSDDFVFGFREGKEDNKHDWEWIIGTVGA